MLPQLYYENVLTKDRRPENGNLHPKRTDEERTPSIPRKGLGLAVLEASSSVRQQKLAEKGRPFSTGKLRLARAVLPSSSTSKTWVIAWLEHAQDAHPRLVGPLVQERKGLPRPLHFRLTRPLRVGKLTQLSRGSSNVMRQGL